MHSNVVSSKTNDIIIGIYLFFSGSETLIEASVSQNEESVNVFFYFRQKKSYISIFNSVQIKM
jgi:hypothetical protein